MRTLIGTLSTGAALLVIAGCGGTVATSSAAGGGAAAPPTSAAAAAGATVTVATVGSHGTVLVAANGRTLYQFAKDAVGATDSACTGGCFSTWAPLTVPSGTTPTGSTAVTGPLGTITRSDGNGTQVTYGGKPVYMYSGDNGPGDANGNYPNWSVVPVSSSAAAGGATTPPTASGTGSGY